MPRPNAVSLLVLLVLAAPASPAEAPAPASLNAAQILAKVAENYRKVRGYTFSCEVATRISANGQTKDVTTRVEGAYGGPGRARLAARTEDVLSLYLTANDSTWTYSGQYGEYTVAPEDTTRQPGGLPGIDTGAGHPLEGYARIDQGVMKAKLAGRDTVSVDGAPVVGDVIEVEYDPALTATREAGVTYQPKRFVVDTARALVLRDGLVVERRHPSLSTSMRFEQTSTFTQLAWDQSPKDERFVFDPPAGAKRVDAIGMPDESNEPVSQLVGQPAPEFSLADLGGKATALSSLRGKVVVLDFWATWCGPCRIEMPEMEKLHKRHGAHGLVVLGVNCNEAASKAGAFVKKGGYTFPILLDKDGSVQRAYEVGGIPTVVVIDGEGKVSSYLVGARPAEAILSALRKAGLNVKS